MSMKRERGVYMETYACMGSCVYMSGACVYMRITGTRVGKHEGRLTECIYN